MGYMYCREYFEIQYPEEQEVVTKEQFYQEMVQWYRQDFITLIAVFGLAPFQGEKWEDKHFHNVIIEILRRPALVGVIHHDDEMVKDCIEMLFSFRDILVRFRFEKYLSKYMTDEWEETIKAILLYPVFVYYIESVKAYGKTINFAKYKLDYIRHKNK